MTPSLSAPFWALSQANRFPAPANASLFLTSSLGLGVSSHGAGTWLARVSLDTRQLFSLVRSGQSQPRPCRANVAQGLDHHPAGSIVRKSFHAGCCESTCATCHGAEHEVLRHE